MNGKKGSISKRKITDVLPVFNIRQFNNTVQRLITYQRIAVFNYEVKQSILL